MREKRRVREKQQGTRREAAGEPETKNRKKATRFCTRRENGDKKKNASEPVRSFFFLFFFDEEALYITLPIKIPNPSHSVNSDVSFPFSCHFLFLLPGVDDDERK